MGGDHTEREKGAYVTNGLDGSDQPVIRPGPKDSDRYNFVFTCPRGSADGDGQPSSPPKSRPRCSVESASIADFLSLSIVAGRRWQIGPPPRLERARSTRVMMFIFHGVQLSTSSACCCNLNGVRLFSATTAPSLLGRFGAPG